jgi:hypothetical protein
MPTNGNRPGRGAAHSDSDVDAAESTPRPPQTQATTYARATSGFDPEHEAELVRVIMTAIGDASMVSDVNCTVIRTGEAASALVSCLAYTLAISPAVTRSPTQMRRTVEEIGKRLRRRIAAAQADADDFRKRCFTSNNTEGSA